MKLFKSLVVLSCIASEAFADGPNIRHLGNENSAEHDLSNGSNGNAYAYGQEKGNNGNAYAYGQEKGNNGNAYAYGQGNGNNGNNGNSGNGNDGNNGNGNGGDNGAPSRSSPGGSDFGSDCVSITKCNWPECKEGGLSARDCKALIENEAAACNETLSVIVTSPLKLGQRGYNFFRITSDADGMVTNPNGLVYYYLSQWRGVSQLGYRSIGPWDCSGMTARDCCGMVKAEVTDPDIDGNYLECRILVPDASGVSGSPTLPGGPDGSSGVPGGPDGSSGAPGGPEGASGVLNCQQNEQGGKQMDRVYIYADDEGLVNKEPCRG